MPGHDCCLGNTPGELLICTDAGYDDTAFIGALSDAGVRFLVKRNLRRECREQYLAMTRRIGEKNTAWEGKNVYRCILSHKQPEGLDGKPIFMVVEALERLSVPDGQPLLIPELEVSTWWTNLPFSEWPAVFADDERLTGALLDRLTHKSNILEFVEYEESYRVRMKLKAMETAGRKEVKAENKSS